MGPPTWTLTHQDSDRMGFPLGELRKRMRRPNRIARDKGDIPHPILLWILHQKGLNCKSKGSDAMGWRKGDAIKTTITLGGDPAGCMHIPYLDMRKVAEDRLKR